MGLRDDCEKYFGTSDLYAILGVEKSATNTSIKKAYRKQSLKIHPDRAEESHKDEATRAFQVLSKVHYILNDEQKRKVYDEQGIILNGNEIFKSFVYT